jgi:hypothetical protein
LQAKRTEIREELKRRVLRRRNQRTERPGRRHPRQREPCGSARKGCPIIEKLRALRLTKAAELAEAAVEETLTYYAFPDNPLERLLREIRRRTRVVALSRMGSRHSILPRPGCAMSPARLGRPSDISTLTLPADEERDH